MKNKKYGKFKIKCRYCGKEFIYRYNTRMFCDMKCYKKGYKWKKNKGSFKKGQVPWNKGVKGIHLSPKSEFKKGNRPYNTGKIGELRIWIDNTKNKRRYIKIGEPHDWIEYSRYVFLKKGYAIPEGCVIHHKDRNTLNDDIDNLECLTRRQHLEEHRKEFNK